MATILSVILLLLGLSMFKISREKKLIIMFASYMLLNSVTISFVPFGNYRYFFCYCFLLSELPFIAKHFNMIRKATIYPLIVMMTIATIVLLINSPHYNSFGQMVRLLVFELVGKYFLILYAYLAVRDDETLKKMLRPTYVILLITTLCGIQNFLSGNSLFIQSISSMALTSDAENLATRNVMDAAYADRLRINATFFSSFDYGFACIALLWFFAWAYMKRYLPKKKFGIVLACCLFGVLFSGSRTNYLALVISIAIFLVVKFDAKKSIVYMVVSFSVLLVVSQFVPFLADKINAILTMFDQNSDYTGSSMDMRLLQYERCFFHIQDHMLFGRGKDFFLIDLGWADKATKGLVDPDLWGAEGVFINRLLESGIVGSVFYIVLCVSLIRMVLKRKNIDRTSASIALAIFSAYFAFANMSGELETDFLTFLMIGMFIKLLDVRKKYV